MRISNHFAHQRQHGKARWVDLADNAAEIELEAGFEFSGQLLHASIVGKAVHLKQLDATIARAQERTLEQQGADAMALPGHLDAESGFALPREHRSDRPELGCTPQNAVDEKAVQHHAEIACRRSMPGDELIRDCACKTPVAAFAIEATQVV